MFKFSLRTPSVFTDSPAYDEYSDIETRLAALEADSSINSTQFAEADNLGTVTLPGSTAYTEIVRIPAGALVVPDVEAIARVYFEYEVSAPDGMILYPAFSQPYAPGASQSLAASTMNSGAAWARVASRPYTDAVTFAGVVVAPYAIELGSPYVWTPLSADGTDYVGPFDLILYVARSTGVGTVQVRNARIRADIV